MNDKPLVDREYLLDKFPGHGGWTYTIIPEIAPDPHSPFGWVKVRGTIDGIEIRDYHLMPGNRGSEILFLSVKADIRKRIKKEAGDHVHLVLYRDDEPLEIPEEFATCLDDDAEALRFFHSLRENEKRLYIKWIYSAKTEQTKVDRIARSVSALSMRRKFADRK